AGRRDQLDRTPVGQPPSEPSTPIGCGFDVVDRLPSRPESMRQRSEIHQRGPIAVSFLIPGPGGRIPHPRPLEALPQELPQVRLDTDVARRTSQDDLLDPTLPQLEDEVIR